MNGLDWLWWEEDNDIHGIDGAIRDCPRRIGTLSTGNVPIAENDLVIIERPGEPQAQRVRVSIIRDLLKDVGAEGNDPRTSMVRIFDESGGLSVLRWHNGLLYYYGASQGSGTVADPYIVNSPESLQRVSDNPSAHYVQTADIDLTGIPWIPLCSYQNNGFSGTYDGQGFSITNMDINIENWNKYVLGLFGYISTGAIVKNLTIKGNISAAYSVPNALTGMLAGQVSGATITNVHAQGNILVASGDAGGFIGFVFESIIERCSFIGSVKATFRVAGFCCNCCSLYNGAKISNCYAQADLLSISNAALFGGFIQNNWPVAMQPSIIENCYCAGIITSTPSIEITPAGFIAQNQGGTITGCLWDVGLNPTLQNPDPCGVGGLSTERMQSANDFQNTYFGWDFDRVWIPPTGTEYPLLRGE